jgi:hypothetical protein
MTLRILAHTCLLTVSVIDTVGTRGKYDCLLRRQTANRQGNARQKQNNKQKEQARRLREVGSRDYIGSVLPTILPWNTPFKLPDWVIWNLGVNKL